MGVAQFISMQIIYQYNECTTTYLQNKCIHSILASHISLKNRFMQTFVALWYSPPIILRWLLQGCEGWGGDPECIPTHDQQSSRLGAYAGPTPRMHTTHTQVCTNTCVYMHTHAQTHIHIHTQMTSLRISLFLICLHLSTVCVKI